MALLSHPLDSVVGGVTERSSAAFRELYDLVSDRLYAFAVRLLRDRQEAEDAVQQAFLELVRADSIPAEGRSLEAWLFASVRFTCHDVFRKRTRRPETVSADLPVVGHDDRPDLGFDPGLEAALAALTPDQRQVIHLKHVEGFDGAEIATIMSTTRAAVYAMATRAEQRLRKLLGAVESVRPAASSPEKER